MRISGKSIDYLKNQTSVGWDKEVEFLELMTPVLLLFGALFVSGRDRSCTQKTLKRLYFLLIMMVTRK